MVARKMTLEEIQNERFATQDVLPKFKEKFERHQKLISAMALTNAQHEPVYLLVMLANGEVVEVYSDLIDYEDDYVEVHGGFGIPLIAICDVGV